MKRNSNYMERKCRGFVHMFQLFCTAVDKVEDLPLNLVVNCPWVMTVTTPELNCSMWLWLKERCWKHWKQVYKNISLPCMAHLKIKTPAIVPYKCSSSRISKDNLIWIICHAILPNNRRKVLCLATGERGWGLSEVLYRSTSSLSSICRVSLDSLLFPQC